MKSSKYFYKDLPYVEDIKEISNKHVYREAPSDWYILIADIENSTILVEEGAYRDVNYIAAAIVSSVVNIDKQLDIPFVFGGDGAVILIPPEFLEQGKDALRDVSQFAKKYFQIDIRIGAVPVIDVQRARRQLKVTKIKLAENYYQSVFHGGGVEHAEFLVRSSKKYKINHQPPKYRADLSGLHCMWHDLSIGKQEVISLLVKTNNEIEVYKNVLEKISEIFGEKDQRRPEIKDRIRYKPNLSQIKFNAKLRSYTFKSNYNAEKFKLCMRFFLIDFPKYYFYKFFKRENSNLPIETEKFDDGLKMIIASNESQRKELKDFLDDLDKDKLLAYGMHVSKVVHITCLVFERKGRQVHFLDGGGSGYTVASKELKNRIKLHKSYM